MKITTRHITRSLVVALAVTVIGCASDSKPVSAPPPQAAPAPKAAPMSATGLDQYIASINASKAQIDSTMASLAELTDPKTTDLRAAYDKYSDQVARLQENARALGVEAEAMRANRGSYFGNWEEKVTEIDNPTIRASAEARRKRLRDAHEQITTASLEAKDAYQPMIKDLQDIRTYLGTDLSKASIADLGEAAKKVQSSGATLKEKLDVITKTLDSIKGA